MLFVDQRVQERRREGKEERRERGRKGERDLFKTIAGMAKLPFRKLIPI